MTPWTERWRRAGVVTLGTTTVVVLAIAAGYAALVHPMAPSPVPRPMTVEAGLVETAPTPPAPRRADPPPSSEPPVPSPSPEPRRQAPPVAKPKEPRPHPPAHAPEGAAPPPSQTTETETAEKAAPTVAPPPRNDGLPGGTSAARAIAQPTPVIPPELRRHLLAVEAVVRFTIAADGNATADLEEATPDPRLNQILLDAFRHWRFFPAMQDGRPTASTLVLRVPIRVE
ncbi:energy transducer TonB [Telmatospirillum siberiense]|uniref:TonB C-terminal domain-containing protein n=1 Tax=Telmatospirillum siberiense TaxID=382514 RepID=A0A2N3Q114_9PROT|nr:energy transducer TonB [Telmatospirillum siberiense]PKU26345.1 hypothetical protein CWS72_00380 [Telmatospirillum siberiense]